MIPKKKKSVLRNTIEKIKNFNIDIIIHTHYPLDVDIQQSVNFVLYSSDNPILTNRLNGEWYQIDERTTLVKYSYNYNYCIIKQMIEGMNFASNFGYSKFHILNYDANIEESLLNVLETYDNVFFSIAKNQILTLIFSVDSTFLKRLKEIDFMTYFDNPSFLMFEVFFISVVLKDFNYKEYSLNLEEANSLYKNEIGIDSRNGMKIIYNPQGELELSFDHFSMFKKDKYCFYLGKLRKSKTFGFLFWRVKEDTKIEFESDTYTKEFNIKNNFIFDTEIKFDAFITNFIGCYDDGVFVPNNKMSIKINGKELDYNVLKLLPLLEIDIEE